MRLTGSVEQPMPYSPAPIDPIKLPLVDTLECHATYVCQARYFFNFEPDPKSPARLQLCDSVINNPPGNAFQS